MISAIPAQGLIARLTAALLLSVTLAVAAQEPIDDTVRNASAVSVFQTEQQAAELTAQGTERKFLPAEAGTPLAAILGFRKFMRVGDYTTAGQYLDTRYVPEDVAAIAPEKLAQALAFVWTQQNVLDITALSDNPEGFQDDGLPEYRDQIGEVQLSEERVPIYLQRIPDGEGGQVWRISNATVAKIPAMWGEHGYSEAAIWLSNHLPRFNVLGMTNWQFVLLLASLLVLWVLSGLLVRALTWVTLRVTNKIPAGITRFWAVPMRLIVYVITFRLVMDQLGLSITARVYLQSSPLEYLAGTVLLLGLITLWRDYKFKQLEAVGELHLTALLKPMILIIKIVIVLVAMLSWAHNAGFNISTLVAGLGVGSLAIALAAQRTMENVIGAATLYAARPIRPGDYCKFGDLKGTVEEIGLRSVTLRTLDRTLVSIPNAKFSADSIENISVRDRIRYFKQLLLQMPTYEQLQVILGEMREMFTAHPKVLQESVSVRLESIEAANAVLRIDAGILTQDFQEYLAIAEDINLRIIQIVHGNGAIFSGPGQVLQVRDFHQANDQTMADVEARLNNWQEQQEFPFPDVSAEKKAQLKGTLPYPPTGPLES